MRIERELFLVVAASLAACHRDAAGPAAAMSPAVPTSTAVVGPLVPPAAPVSAAPSPSDPVCVSIAAENDAVVDAASVACAPATEPAEGRKRLEDARASAAFRHCKRDARGWWALKLTKASLSSPAAESGEWCGATLEYVWLRVSLNGERSSTKPAAYNSFRDETTNLELPIQYDYDGDGADELIVQRSDWQNGNGSSQEALVLRAGAKGPEPYPVGYRYDRVVDADRDGRPDLVNGEYFVGVGPCGLNGETLLGPSMLLHALAGGRFSPSDHVAQAWAAAECPYPPAPPPYITAIHAACARVWGKSAESIVASIKKPAQCGMENRETVRALVKADPPFPAFVGAGPSYRIPHAN